MTSDFVLHLGRRTMETALLLGGPVLLVTLVVGVVTSILQAITSIRDTTLATVIKFAAAGATLLLCGGWMLETTMQFTVEVFDFMQTAQW